MNKDLLFKFIDGDSFIYLFDRGEITNIKKHNRVYSGIHNYENFTVCYIVGNQSETEELKTILKEIGAFVSEDYNFIPEALINWYFRNKEEESGMTYAKCVELLSEYLKEKE